MIKSGNWIEIYTKRGQRFFKNESNWKSAIKIWIKKEEKSTKTKKKKKEKTEKN